MTTKNEQQPDYSALVGTKHLSTHQAAKILANLPLDAPRTDFEAELNQISYALRTSQLTHIKSGDRKLITPHDFFTWAFEKHPKLKHQLLKATQTLGAHFTQTLSADSDNLITTTASSGCAFQAPRDENDPRAWEQVYRGFHEHACKRFQEDAERIEMLEGKIRDLQPDAESYEQWTTNIKIGCTDKGKNL